MIFVGEKEKSCYINNIKEVDCVELYTNLNKQKEIILKKGKTDFTIFDITAYSLSPEELIRFIREVCDSNNSKAIIYAVPYMKYIKYLNAFIINGFKNFITAPDEEGQAVQLRNCLSGYNESLKLSLYEEKENVEQIHEIAIMGTQSRIGTTTYSIQLAKFLQNNGYKTCYVQVNNSSYFLDVMKYMQPEDYDDYIKKLEYNELDHYDYKCFDEEIAELYEYVIYDFGCYVSSDFNRELYLSMDKNICITGFAPQEISNFLKIAQNPFYNDITFIVNFSDNSIHEKVKQILTDDKKFLISDLHISDSYVVSNEYFYRNILNVENRNMCYEKEQENKKDFLKMFSIKRKRINAEAYS